MKKFITIVATVLISLTINAQVKKKAVETQPKWDITYDKFEGTYSYNGVAGSLSIYAIGKNKDFADLNYTALYATVYDSYLTYASDLIILFSDGTKMELSTNEELGDDTGKGLWKYYIAAHPTNEQWKELASKKIVGFKLGIFPRDYKKSAQFQILANKMIQKNTE